MRRIVLRRRDRRVVGHEGHDRRGELSLLDLGFARPALRHHHVGWHGERQITGRDGPPIGNYVLESGAAHTMERPANIAIPDSVLTVT